MLQWDWLWQQLEYVLLITGWIGTFGFGYYVIYQDRQNRTFDLKQLINAGRSLARDLRRENFLPEFIVVPGEKNALIAHFLNQNLEKSAMVIVGTQCYNFEEVVILPDASHEIKTSRSKLFFHSDLSFLKNRRVLFVDSIKKSGETMQQVRGRLLEIGVNSYQFKSLCLVESESYPTAEKFNFVYKRMRGDVFFPWQKIDAA